MTVQQPVVPASEAQIGWHWIKTMHGTYEPAFWSGLGWYRAASSELFEPARLARVGWTYIGPVPEPAMEGGDG
ncbi:hypothetical protein NFI95_05885 [Acetobacteraceae bacterium KSS8]|uniref:Uncharacterized protein n=1 Tax=Endosaccharibacter trunci TaxID=2812733 RepID=A0ABT1W520_9PROT|nr:hypothetical protein [Acetobacteraceae bacterium KSS8]